MYVYRSYYKNKLGVRFLEHPVCVHCSQLCYLCRFHTVSITIISTFQEKMTATVLCNVLCVREQLISQGACGDGVCLSDIAICDLERVAAKSNISVSNMMNEAYRAVGDPDGIYGCGTERHGNTVAR